MPYIYRIENIITKQFYYGARYTEKVLPKDDIWVGYFTSSKSVKKLIAEYGINSFSVSIISVFLDEEICYSNEQEIIKNNIQNPLCLNKQYTLCGEKVFLNKGHSEETKLKISSTSSGRNPWNAGITGYKKKSISDEGRKNMSLAKKGKPSPKKGLPSPLKGRKQTEEQKMKTRKLWEDPEYRAKQSAARKKP